MLTYDNGSRVLIIFAAKCGPILTKKLLNSFAIFCNNTICNNTIIDTETIMCWFSGIHSCNFSYDFPRFRVI